MGKASKPSAGSAVDSVTLHRKLEPIYEMIDSRNNKAALKAIAQLLSKYPGLQIGRVLKGIVVQRMGKDEEGYEHKQTEL